MAQRRPKTVLVSSLGVWLGLAGVSLGQGQLSSEEYDELRAVVESVLIAGSVCDVGLLPASPNRPDTIVAVVDFSGRLFCNTIVRVSRTDPPSILQDISGWWVASLDSGGLEIIQDVDRDGEAELVVPTAMSDYEGDRVCVATLPYVYRCDADECVDVSRESTEFYRGWQSVVESQLSDAESSSEEGKRGIIPCIVMARDKVERLVGTNPGAGFDTAERWMGSADPLLQRKAVWVFADIVAETGDADARQRLQTLAESGHDYTRILSWLERRK